MIGVGKPEEPLVNTSIEKPDGILENECTTADSHDEDTNSDDDANSHSHDDETDQSDDSTDEPENQLIIGRNFSFHSVYFLTCFHVTQFFGSTHVLEGTQTLEGLNSSCGVVV